jgi:hypothetical protein
MSEDSKDKEYVPMGGGISTERMTKKRKSLETEVEEEGNAEKEI